MQFIKKNYEKVLLGVVLLGLVAVAVFLLFLVSSEKQNQEERRNKIINHPVKPLEAMDATHADTLLKRVEVPFVVSLSDNLHKLFNPVRWQKTVDGRYLKNPVGSDLQKLEVTKITPLYLNISLESVIVSDSGSRYVIGIEQQASSKANLRVKRSYYVSKGDKKEYGDNKETFTLRDVVGPADNPTAVILDMSEMEKPISISKDKPFSRADGYMADLRFAPENRNFPGRRVGDKISIADEKYNIVAIAENEVVLLAESNQKKWTIKYNAAP